MLTILRKLLNHPTLVYRDETQSSVELKSEFPSDYQPLLWNLSSKFIFLENIVDKLIAFENTSEKMIIVSYYTQTLDVVDDLLKQKAIQFCRLDGKIQGDKRQSIVDRFNDKSSNI